MRTKSWNAVPVPTSLKEFQSVVLVSGLQQVRVREHYVNDVPTRRLNQTCVCVCEQESVCVCVWVRERACVCVCVQTDAAAQLPVQAATKGQGKV